MNELFSLYMIVFLFGPIVLGIVNVILCLTKGEKIKNIITYSICLIFAIGVFIYQIGVIYNVMFSGSNSVLPSEPKNPTLIEKVKEIIVYVLPFIIQLFIFIKFIISIKKYKKGGEKTCQE